MLRQIIPVILMTIWLAGRSNSEELKPTPKYFMKFMTNVTLDCSSLNDDQVDFYESKRSSDTELDFSHICNDTDQNKWTDKTGKILTIRLLKKDDMNQIYKCVGNKTKETIMFNRHPIFVSGYKEKVNILSSGFRLVLPFQTMAENCLWYFTPKKNPKDQLKLTTENTLNSTKFEVSNNTLNIFSPEDTDSGDYTCILSNEYGKNVNTVEVKIQSQMLAFWPFAIIFAQVLLCSLIFMLWEKRCSGRDSSNEYSFDQVYVANKPRQDPAVA